MSASHGATAGTPRWFPDDPRALPGGSVVDGSAAGADLEDVADYVVIGSGAAGATSALTLAEAGFSVALLEEGPWVRTREFGVDVFPAMRRMFRESGTQVAIGRAPFPLVQGRCVGGGTTVNSAIAWRAPETVLEHWAREFGLGDVLSPRTLEPHYEFLEETLNVQAVADRALGPKDHMLADAARSAGIRAERIRRYDGGCESSASCLTGCRTGRKLGMNITYVPQTLHRGGRIYTHARAERIEQRHGRAVAVVARLEAPGSPRLRILARRGVLVAASAAQSANVLRRSGIRLGRLGRHFQAHPGTTMVARFDRPVAMDVGATQGYNSTHYVDSGRYKIESLTLPPELLCARMPDVGPRLMAQMTRYDHLLNWAIILRGEAEGTVGRFLGREQVSYTPTPADMLRLRTALKNTSELMFAAGASEVFASVHGMPRLRSADDLSHWDGASLDPRDYGIMASHLFGGARMGRDERSSVVGEDFQVHGTRGVYVVDSSVFPTNLGVNPQHSIMAVARLAASRIQARPLPPSS